MTSQPYQQTRAATSGPDVTAAFNDTGPAPRGLYPARKFQALIQTRASRLIHARGVSAYSGPYPIASAVVRVNRLTAGAEIEGRTWAPAAVD